MKNILLIVLFIASFIACKTDTSKQNQNTAAPATAEPKAEIKADTMHAHTYVCPMHPEVTSDKSDAKCPKCGMALVLKK